ncbi:lamin tail domain-containing protein [Halorussus amylolyticus]|uniref:lamin tail domain-containing protein n=1 Tax=Halorussus amylolyticus TaxID=1126242 RepID=UPI00192F5CBC|nr:lamin tail domain-containing protein [Halorussus amylolyticus]
MSARFRSCPVVRAVLAVVVMSVLFAGCLGGSGTLTDSPSGEETASPTEMVPADDSTSAGESTSTDDSTGGATSTETRAAGNLSVHFVNVGQGASVLVVGPTGETLLYDTGNWNDDGAHVIDYLRARNVTRIDYLVTSHADADHIGGHAAVIDHFETEADGVGAVYDPGIAAATRTYERYLDAVEEHDVTLYRAQAGDSIPMAGAEVGVLSPPEGYFSGEDRNENSLVLRVARGNASVLLTGDAERNGERYLLETASDRLDASVLAAGHHGSNTSTGPGLLAASDPQVAVIQSAYDSPYDHPHRELLERLTDREVPTYWTGVHGSVAFETDGERFAVRTQRAAATDPLGLRDAPEIAPGSDDPLEPRARFPARGGTGVTGAGSATSAEETTDSETTTAATDGGTDSATSSAAALEVAEVHADAAGDDRENLNDEYVVLRNGGDRTLDLSGWTVGDEADHRYAFPEGTALDPGESLTLYTGSGTDGGGDYYWGSGTPIWNNDGDTVFVRTAEGELVAEESYDS